MNLVQLGLTDCESGTARSDRANIVNLVQLGLTELTL